MPKVKCPKCGAATPTPEDSARDMRCQKCKHVFKTPSEAGVSAGLPPHSKAAKKAVAKPKPAKASSSTMVWVLVAVLMLGVMLVGVVVIAGVAFVFLYATPQKQMVAAENRIDPEFVIKGIKDKALDKNDFWFDKDKGKELKDKKGFPPDRDRAIIRDVMKNGFGRNMTRDFTTGKATPEQKEQLVVLFTDFASTRSPSGNDADWNMRTAALLAAVKADDRKGFQVASNCAGCHREHKGRK